LEALFNWHTGALGDEENYLQGLTDSNHENERIRQWLSFFLGEEEDALDITDIRELIKPREITEIPRSPVFILGIISLRGVIIPVFDLRQRLKLGAGEISPTSRIIVCQQGGKSAGLLVDSITQVVRIPEHAIEPPPAVLSGLDRDLVDAVGRHEERMLILLDLSCVMNAELI
jgi:purine-binding chemotaxis protein CheW